MAEVYSPKRLYIGQPDDSEDSIYTADSDVDSFTIVKQVLLCNTTGSAADISLSAVPNGDTAGDANRIISEMSIAAHDTKSIDFSLVLGPDDFLSALNGTSAAITVAVYGVEHTA